MLERLLEWDRQATLFINGSSNLCWDEVIYVATSTLTWIPVGLLVLWMLWKNLSLRQFYFAVFFLVVAVFVSDQLSSSVFKPFFQRWRPTQDPLIMYCVDVVHDYRGGRYGFFSAHASNTFSVAVFLACLVRRKYLGWLIVSWAVLNSYTRVYLGVHYLGDVLVGTFWGILIGCILSKIYRKRILMGSDASILTDDKYACILAIGLLSSYCLAFIVALIRLW